MTELAGAAANAIAALSPDDGEGGAELVARAERSVAPLAAIAPALASAGEALRGAELALREVGMELRRFLDSLEAEPGRLEEVEGRLEQIADLRRRYRADTFAELIERAADARSKLDALAEGHDPGRAAADAVAAAQAEVDRLPGGASRCPQGGCTAFRRGRGDRARRCRPG